MSVLNFDDTIIACSTGLTSNSAIAIIRISGQNFLEKVQPFLDLETIKPRYAHFCKILDNGVVLDEIVLTYFKGPNSYNGEDICELSVHGNQLHVKRLIRFFIENCSFRYAMPGEFTQRALKNKKLSLSQVEGLDLLLNANNVFSLDQGFSLLSGKLQDAYLDLQKVFLNHKSSLEFGFDFLEDIGEDKFNEEFTNSLNALGKAIIALKSRVANQAGKIIKPDICLFGPPNAGKSTLFNALLLENRAITSKIAGTTRDFISEDLFIGDDSFNLLDTAGIRFTEDSIEEQGIALAKDKALKSFYKILVINPFEFDLSDLNSLEKLSFDSVVFTHGDQEGFLEASSVVIKKLNSILDIQIGPIEPSNSGPIEPSNSGPIEPSKSGPIEPITADLIKNSQEIRVKLEQNIEFKYKKLLGNKPILLERQGSVINEIYLQFNSYKTLAESDDDMAIISSELNILGHCISELIGIVSPDDVLQNIFSNFCIGK